MIYKKYILISQISEKVCDLDKHYDFQKFWFSQIEYEKKSPGGFELVSDVHKPDTLTTELWWYSTETIDTNNLTKHLHVCE